MHKYTVSVKIHRKCNSTVFQKGIHRMTQAEFTADNSRWDMAPKVHMRITKQE